MKLLIFNREKTKSGERELPSQFGEEYRPDLIKRAVLALNSSSRQRYGTFPEAGMRHSARLSKRRRNYRGSYGLGISRVNRKILSRRGTRMNWVGAITPQTVGGRRAHGPKSSKILEEKINKKERRKAIRSAIAATVNSLIVKQRGHAVPTTYPFIMDSSFEQLQKTSEIEKALITLGFEQELERTSQRGIRAGKGKMRGRKYKHRKGILIIVSQECPLMKAAGNIPGVDIVPVKSLNAGLLAPGALPGRATLWSAKAVDILEKEKLFL